MTTNIGWQCFLEICLAAKDKKTLSGLFDVLITHEERASIETRCLIVQALLEQKISQRQISEDLNVSISKITRGSNELKRISPQLKQYLLENLKLNEN